MFFINDTVKESDERAHVVKVSNVESIWEVLFNVQQVNLGVVNEIFELFWASFFFLVEFGCGVLVSWILQIRSEQT